MADCLSLWRTGDAISAYRLNEMTIGINEAAKLAEELAVELNGIQRGSSTAVGGLSDGRAFTTAKPQFMKQNRGVILDQWDFKIRSSDEEGVYVRCSGFENATSSSYPDSPGICKIAGLSEIHNGQELMQTVYTDCWGKVKCSKIEVMTESVPSPNLWQGSSCSCSEYKLQRRLGRIVDACFEFSCGSIPKVKVMETNDLVMPILPARAEMEENHPCHQSLSLIGNFKENSVLIKNIKNGGGLDLTPCTTNLQLKSGVEFYAGEISASCGGTPTTTFPDVTGHIKPQEFDITIACVPIKEQHYKWCKTSNSWVTSYECGAGSCAIAPCDKGSIKITAKSLCGNNWQIGWTSSGEVVIPVKDFTPTESVSYEAGRGISICKQSTTDDEGNIIDKSIICNTMEICAGCNISVEQVDGDKPAYKINACKMKIEAGDGIKVECIQGGYKISACKKDEICINAGTGISVTKSNNAYTITNTSVHDPIVVSAGNGIEVSQVGNNYTVSVKAPCSTCCVCICGVKYSFDPAWFIVTDTNVTINEAKINEVAAGIAPNVSSQITSTATAAIDTWTDETGYKGYSGNINATIVTECGTAATASVTSSRN